MYLVSIVSEVGYLDLVTSLKYAVPTIINTAPQLLSDSGESAVGSKGVVRNGRHPQPAAYRRHMQYHSRRESGPLVAVFPLLQTTGH